ncbi:MAG: TIM44-like domain-containing protein [Archangiaceae bacterium]|nr:TIM44-like domain-containing protein [Archangiaceae bacterium]
MINRARWPLYLAVLSIALPAFARIGGGEHYAGSNNNSNDGGGSGGDGELVGWLIYIAIRHPVIGIPLLVGFVLVAWYMKSQEGSASTKKAFQQAEAQVRTTVSAQAVTQWVGALKQKDPSFDLLHLFDNVKKLFLEVQGAWFRRSLEPVRRYLSDATFQRLSLQLRLLDLQGIRDAISDYAVVDLQIIGLEQNEHFDTVHVRVKAQMRDADAPSRATDEQALALAAKQQLEPFIEVWSFVRKPGAVTNAAKELSNGKCPNCGAPFEGGAANRCQFCSAVVNSGNYDWVLAEITQGSEFTRGGDAVEGFARARQTDPALSSETLEDRGSLIFWKWVEAQATGNPTPFAKLCGTEYLTWLSNDLKDLKGRGKRKVFLECAVGAVNTRRLDRDGDVDLAHLEVRWSARMGIGPADEKPPSLPVVPQRWVFTLQRKAGATTNAANGMSTNRCPNCSAPLSDNGQPSCEFCGTMLQSGERDWVLKDARVWESWAAMKRPAAASAAAASAPRDRVVSKEERERLLYMMAAMAAADGVVDGKERELLKDCSARWSVPWANVELALSAGSNLFDRLVQKGTPEAEHFMNELVSMALIDGKIDRSERKMLEAAAQHLGVGGATLSAMLQRSS